MNTHCSITRNARPSSLCLALSFALAGLAAPAHAAPLAPVSYDMLNGYGNANSGSYNYWDKAYTGSGNTSVDFDPLSGGLGDLTDGTIATQRWDMVENLEGTGPYVGWSSIYPSITFHFGATQNFGSVTVWHDDANGHGNVATPSAFSVTVGAKTQRFDITDPATDTPFASVLNLGRGFVGDTLILQVFRYDTAVFLSEVQFTNAAAVPEPATWAGMAVGLVGLMGLAARRRKAGG